MKASERILLWLAKHPGTASKEDLIELVKETVEDCAKHVERFEGVDFDMRERFK
jgi:hypothetical protein